jgi:hypothetical protein
MTRPGPRDTRPGPRGLLLDDILTHARPHGLAGASLRALAAAVGTSHRDRRRR